MFVQPGQSGSIYHFFLYPGKNSANKVDCSCENVVVLRLCEGILRQQNFKINFDNCFCMLPLILKMKYFGIHTSSTIITN